MKDLNYVPWFSVVDKQPPNNVRIITVDMNASVPRFVDSLYANGRCAISNHTPTHWTYSLSFPPRTITVISEKAIAALRDLYQILDDYIENQPVRDDDDLPTLGELWDQLPENDTLVKYPDPIEHVPDQYKILDTFWCTEHLIVRVMDQIDSIIDSQEEAQGG